MASRKTKSEATAAKVRPAAVAIGERASRQSARPATTSDSNRLLREAAWSRMFGRIEAKNPFAR